LEGVVEHYVINLEAMDKSLLTKITVLSELSEPNNQQFLIFNSMFSSK